MAVYAAVALSHTVGIQGLGFDSRGSGGIGAAFVTVAVLTLVNALVRPVVKLLLLPLSCLTFGFFGLIVNALMFLLVGRLGVGLRVDGFLPALFGSVVTSLLFGVLNTFLHEDKGGRRG